MLVKKSGLKFYDRAQFDERGTVIITALLFMALATAIVVAVAFKQSLNLTQTQLIFDVNKLWLVQKSMEAEAEKKLAKLLEKPGMYTKENYSSVMDWKPIFFKKEIGEVVFKTTILDAQAYFDINSLQAEEKETEHEITSQQLFSNILDRKIGDNTQVKRIIKETRAYVGPKLVPRGGNENHLPMSSITELRLLPSLTGQFYLSLFKGMDPGYLFALPVTESNSSIKININTVSSDLLSILLPDFPIEQLNNRPFKNINAVGETGYTNFSDYFDVKSTFFLIKTEGKIQARERTMVMYSLIQAVKNEVSKKMQFQLIWFSQGTI